MKRIAIAAAAAMLALGTAQAQTASPLYGELGYTFQEISVDTPFGSASANPQALRGIIGYNVHPYFAVEGLLAIGTASDDGIKVDNTFGVFVKPKYNVNNFELFGRLGWARTKVKATASGATGSDNDLAWGLGVNYNLNPRTYVGLDYLRSFDKDDVRVDGVTISVGYRF